MQILRTVEDAVWTYFGYPSKFWQDKCSNCREKILQRSMPVSEVPECLNCWKIEVWSQSPWFLESVSRLDPTWAFENVLDYMPSYRCEPSHGDSNNHSDFSSSLIPLDTSDSLFGLACNLAMHSGELFVAKLARYPIQVVRSGEPGNQYPNVVTDRLLMAYASTIREREGLRQAICRQLAMNPLKAEDIPVRRGCWLYDDILGPWQGWYEIDKDSTS